MRDIVIRKTPDFEILREEYETQSVVYKYAPFLQLPEINICVTYLGC